MNRLITVKNVKHTIKKLHKQYGIKNINLLTAYVLLLIFLLRATNLICLIMEANCFEQASDFKARLSPLE